MDRIVYKMDKEFDYSPMRTPHIDAPVISFAELLAEKDDNDDDDDEDDDLDRLSSHDEKQGDQESTILPSPIEQPAPASNVHSDR